MTSSTAPTTARVAQDREADPERDPEEGREQELRAHPLAEAIAHLVHDRPGTIAHGGREEAPHHALREAVIGRHEEGEDEDQQEGHHGGADLGHATSQLHRPFL